MEKKFGITSNYDIAPATTTGVPGSMHGVGNRFSKCKTCKDVKYGKRWCQMGCQLLRMGANRLLSWITPGAHGVIQGIIGISLGYISHGGDPK